MLGMVFYCHHLSSPSPSPSPSPPSRPSSYRWTAGVFSKVRVLWLSNNNLVSLPQCFEVSVTIFIDI